MTLIAIHHDMSFQDKLTVIIYRYTGEYDG